MSWADNYIKALETQDTISFRPVGNSMLPKIKSRQLVTVSSDISNINIGDIVLAKVKGSCYLHYVTSIKTKDNKTTYQISNAKGHINGWTSKLYAKVIEIHSD